MFNVIDLENVNINDLTDIWNQCWRTNDPHQTTSPFTVEHLKAYILINKISLRHSVGITYDQRIIGFSLVGINGDRGWIASLGIAPHYRRKGLSKIILHYQVKTCDLLGLRAVTLEVKNDSFMVAVYQLFGFCYYKELTNFNLTHKNFNTLEDECYLKYSYSEVTDQKYFLARAKVNMPFSWRREEPILKNYQRLSYHLRTESESGYIIQNRKILLDIWAVSMEGAKSALKSVAVHLDDILISNQINDCIWTFLLSHDINPVQTQLEMIRFRSD